jgi:hypothetical protein
LPAGNYMFLFGIDTLRNGTLDLSQLQYDYAVLRVLEALPPADLPDVTVTGIDCNGGPLSVTIANTGSTDISPNAVGSLNIWIDGELEWTYSWSTLTCQDFHKAGGMCVIQPQVLTGTHTVRACMDSDDELTESDENNNCMEVTLCCGGAGS